MEQGATRRAREQLLAEYAQAPFAGGEDIDDHLAMLREAVGARNGWKRILARCAESPRRGKCDAAPRATPVDSAMRRGRFGVQA